MAFHPRLSTSDPKLVEEYEVLVGAYKELLERQLVAGQEMKVALDAALEEGPRRAVDFGDALMTVGLARRRLAEAEAASKAAKEKIRAWERTHAGLVLQTLDEAAEQLRG